MGRAKARPVALFLMQRTPIVSTTLKLYESSSSPNSRRVRIFLAEKGICVSRIPIDLAAKEQFTDAYARINPRRVVPTLVIDDGTAIGEVPAIFRYIEEASPNTPLLGTSPKDKALVTMWERRMELEGFAAVMETVRNKAPGLKERALSGPHAYAQIPALVERGRQRVTDFYSDLELRLNEVPFVAGDAFSAADITAVVTVDFATTGLEMAIPDANGATRHWYERISARASFGA